MVDLLKIPNVFSSEYCAYLIRAFNHPNYGNGGMLGGVAEYNHGNAINPNVKYRLDWTVNDISIKWEIYRLIHQRLIPMVENVFDMPPQELERCLIGKFPTGGFFAPHKDNMGRLTWHRNFEISLPLNTEFEGGEIVFNDLEGLAIPKLSKGDALVYRAGLTHELRTVTAGERYGFSSFLYSKGSHFTV